MLVPHVSSVAVADIFIQSLLIQLGVKECIIQADEKNKDYELGKLRALLDRCGIVMTFKKTSDFSIKDIDQDLPRLLTNEVAAGILPQTESKLAMGAASALIKYLGVCIYYHTKLIK